MLILENFVLTTNTFNRVQTDPGKQSTQGNSGNFFSKTHIEIYWHNMINVFLAFAFCILSEFSF